LTKSGLLRLMVSTSTSGVWDAGFNHDVNFDEWCLIRFDIFDDLKISKKWVVAYNKMSMINKQPAYLCPGMLAPDEKPFVTVVLGTTRSLWRLAGLCPTADHLTSRRTQMPFQFAWRRNQEHFWTNPGGSSEGSPPDMHQKFHDCCAHQTWPNRMHWWDTVVNRTSTPKTVCWRPFG
jgi:hypothetical protein